MRDLRIYAMATLKAFALAVAACVFSGGVVVCALLIVANIYDYLN